MFVNSPVLEKKKRLTIHTTCLQGTARIKAYISTGLKLIKTDINKNRSEGRNIKSLHSQEVKLVLYITTKNPHIMHEQFLPKRPQRNAKEPSWNG